jgi:hypothetical protein
MIFTAVLLLVTLLASFFISLLYRPYSCQKHLKISRTIICLFTHQFIVWGKVVQHSRSTSADCNDGGGGLVGSMGEEF